MIPEHPFFFEQPTAYVRLNARCPRHQGVPRLRLQGRFASRFMGEGRPPTLSISRSPCGYFIDPSRRLPTPLWITVGKSGDKWRPRWISGTSIHPRYPGPAPTGPTTGATSSRRVRRLVTVVSGVSGALRAHPRREGADGLPARFREALAGGVILTRGIDRCLALYPLAAWQPLAEKVTALPITDADARIFRRLVFAEADLTLDAQGRILIPPDLRRYAEIEREALVVGVDASIEIWSPQRWAAVEASLDTDAAEIAQRLASLL